MVRRLIKLNIKLKSINIRNQQLYVYTYNVKLIVTIYTIIS